jgi:hypothetical protein
VGRGGRRHHENLVEVESLGKLPRYGYMAVVDRIEGATEYADFFHSDFPFAL